MSSTASPLERPFAQTPFDRLPERPRLPHPYFDVPSREVIVDSPHFGRTRTFVRELGSGPPLVLVHGLMTSSYSFRYVLEPLAERYRVIAFDLPGSGRTDKPDVSYGPDALASFIGELIDAVSAAGCRVIGNSMGGYLAMRLALDRPGIMRGLVALHPPGVPLKRLQALSVALRAPGAHGLLDWMLARDPERWVHRNVHYWDETLKSREETAEYGAPLRTPEGRRAFRRHLSDALAPAPMARFVERLAGSPFPVPLLLVYARRDPMVPPKVGERLAKLLPGATFEWIERGSHFAHVDAPEAFLGAALPWLERLG